MNNIEIPVVEEFKIEDTPRGSKKIFWLKLISDGLGAPVCVPLMVVRGQKDTPILGLTAAVHGNELNGIPVIQRVFNNIDPAELEGTIVAIPVVNIPSFIQKKRRFNDGTDLNHIMPGKADGNISQVYAYRFFDRVVKKMNYLLDLHTASTGRTNTFYVRADMDNPVVRKMTLLQNPQIIVHNPPSDGTLRGAADELNIPAITLEVGNPSIFQRRLIRSGVEGIDNVLSYLNMIEDEIEPPKDEPVICKKSYWLYTDTGGLLNLHVALFEKLEKGQHIATIRDVFGQEKLRYYAPEDGIVIGKSVAPVNQSGGRILHLGILE
ncbi:MAG: putative deacylase [Saprospiraceae bacterium]|jgi:predicted deacylase